MAREPDVALPMTTCGSPVNRTIVRDISSKSMASRTMLTTFATNHALLKVMLYYVI